MNPLETQILELFKQKSELSSGDISNLIKTVSQITIKRNLTTLTKKKFLQKKGKGRSVKYELSDTAMFLTPFNVTEYLKLSETERRGQVSFNFNVFNNLNCLSFDIFSDDENKRLKEADKRFQENKKESSDTIHKKELERFIIELSWKSSKIEGNTYDLLETEQLLRFGIVSKKHTTSETQMILNHKKAFDFIYANPSYFSDISIQKIEEVHYLLTHELGIKINLRKFPVGITGTSYRPLDNEFQIREALEKLVIEINKIENVFVKALFIVLGISYIQPFEDGNKRTSRLLGNAVLLACGLAPLSYRDVDEREYRGASLIFYEQNSVEAFKKIFVEQYIFSCNNYNLG